jgi:hypothetical protein
MRFTRRVGAAMSLALVLLAVTAQTAADPGLTALVNSAYFPRTEDGSLHVLAHERAQYQVAYSGGVCNTDGSLTHDGLVTAEVLACNYAGPERAVEQWLGSPTHHSLLSDPSYNLIGCAAAAGSDGSTFYACTLSTASVAQPTPAPVVPAPPAEVAPPPQPDPPQATSQPVLLPNTATEAP